MWPATRQSRCAEDVGAFLAELQAALTIEDAGALGCGEEAAIRRYEAITARTLSRRRIALYHALAMRGIEAGKTAMMRW